ncbi:hypothetical protein HHI36_002644, partial [Cryptolaemus montrouzieri]
RPCSTIRMQRKLGVRLPVALNLHIFSRIDLQRRLLSHSSFTALMAKYRNSSLEIDYTSNSTPHSLSSSTLVDNSESTVKNLSKSSNSEVASSSLIRETTSRDFELSLNSEILPKNIAPNSNTQCMSGHSNPSFNIELLSEGATSSLDYQTTLGDVDSSSTCDLSINETNICDDIPDTNTDGIETGRQLKNVCLYCDKDRKQNKGKQQNLHSSNDTKLYQKIIEWMEKLNNVELLQKINRLKSSNRTIFIITCVN